MGLITKTELKNVTGDFNVSAEFKEALEDKVREIVVKGAMRRCKANNRNTLYARDL